MWFLLSFDAFLVELHDTITTNQTEVSKYFIIKYFLVFMRQQLVPVEKRADTRLKILFSFETKPGPNSC